MHRSSVIRSSAGGRRGALALLLVAAACGPLEGDDDDWRLNDPEHTRRMAASCPNGGNTVPPARQFTKSIDGYAAYDGQDTCSGSEKPGVVAFKNLVLATYPCTRSLGIIRGCSVGGTSEHKEGRAWDWGLNYPHPAADAFLKWLLATDEFGNKHAMARRFGIMYMVWNRKIWKSYQASKGWQSYTGSNPHTDHVHISFSWPGARKDTSYWRAPAAPPPPPPNAPPKGYLDAADCSAIEGWAQDPTAPDKAVTVEIYVDETPAKEGAVAHPVKANDHRDDLCQAIGSCEHGFAWALPAELRDGEQHTVRAYALDTGSGKRTELTGSPKQVLCTPDTPIEQNLEEVIDDEPIGVTDMNGGGRLNAADAPSTLLGGGCALGGTARALPSAPLLLLGWLAAWRRRRRPR